MTPPLLEHLHASFLSGRASDITLRVLHPWRAEYKLHRIVLLQAGFFEMLFEGGYKEAAEKAVVLRFGDPNITRAAFELCLAHLYHPVPIPSPPPSYIPTPLHPLTPSYPTPPQTPSPTPRLLLSLLATSCYLATPSLVSETTRLLLGSVGPWTVGRYLGFAVGKGIGDKDAGEEDSEEGVKGLARPLPGPSIYEDTEDEQSDGEEDDSDPLNSAKCTSRSPPPTPTPLSSTSSKSSSSSSQTLTSYGPPTNLLGQTCVAWLCRWGVQLLAAEESAFSDSAPPPLWRKSGLPPEWVRAIISSDEFWVGSEMERWGFGRRVVDLRREGWARERERGGKGEREEEEREWEGFFAEGVYYTHMTFEDLIQISQSISPHTHKPYTPLRVLQRAHWAGSLLRTAIQASAGAGGGKGLKPGELGLMKSVEEIRELATAQLESEGGSGSGEETAGNAWFAVPPDDAQRIGDLTPASASAVATSQSPTTPTGKGKRGFDERSWFGVGQGRRRAEEIARDGAEREGEGWTPFEPYRFSVEFFSASSLRVDKSRVPKIHSRTVFYAGSFFNVYIQVVRKKADKPGGAAGGDRGGGGGKDDGTQLGVYLQRWSMVEPIPPASAPAGSGPGGGLGHRRGESAGSAFGFSLGAMAHSMSSPNVGASGLGSASASASTPGTPTSVVPPVGPRSMTPSSLPRQLHTGPISRSASPPPPASPMFLPGPSSPSPFPLLLPPHIHTSLPPTPPQPYRDPRPTLRAFFTVSCCSALGTSLTRFSSAPDKFDVGQSWGWKSSCLREGETGEGEGGLRVSVVIGLV